MSDKWGKIGVPILIAIIGFAGGVLGHKMASDRSKYIEKLDNINSHRFETYQNFFSALAKYKQAQDYGYDSYYEFINNKPEDHKLAERLEITLWEYHMGVKEARFKIAAFAPRELVEALADYYVETSKMPQCSPSWKSDVKTYLAMRKELLDGIESVDVDPAKMYVLMFNCIPPELVTKK